MADLLLRAARAFVDGAVRPATVVVDGGRILRISGFDEAVEADLEPAADEVPLPGLVDTQLHVNEPGRTADTGLGGGAVPAPLGRVEAPRDEGGVIGFKALLAPSGDDEFPELDRDRLQAALAEAAGSRGLLIVHAEDSQVLAAAPHPAGRHNRRFVGSRPPADLVGLGADGRIAAGVDADLVVLAPEERHRVPVPDLPAGALSGRLLRRA